MTITGSNHARCQPPEFSIDPADRDVIVSPRLELRFSKSFVIWVSQGEDEESAGPGAADALEAAFDRDDRCEAWRTGERGYQFPSINGRACNSKTSAIYE